MSKILVDTMDTRSGTSNITIGSSNASQITLKSGATLTNFPEQTPAWFAALPAGGQSVANGSGTKMALTREDLDTNSAYDTSNYRFTVPTGHAGKYWITLACGQQGWSSVRFEAQLHKNGSSVFLCEQNTSGTSYATTNGSCVLTLSVGDYLELYLYHNNGSTQTVRGSDTELFTYFGGYKLIGV